MEKIEIGYFIQNRRKKLSLKQEDLAEMTGLSSKSIYLVENGKANPSLTTLQKLLDVLGLDLFIDIKKVSE
jgi:y4mF family transcriptional regulator